MPIRRSTKNTLLSLLICLSCIFLFNGCAGDPQTSYQISCSDTYIYMLEERSNSGCLSNLALYVDYGKDHDCNDELSNLEIENTYFVCSEELTKPGPTPENDASPSPSPTPQASATPTITPIPSPSVVPTAIPVAGEEEGENQCRKDMNWIWDWFGHHKHKKCINKKHR